jgi:shikimate dehydrogenase
VAQIKYDPNSLGALVTTHKIDLYNAARDMFDYFDPYSEITGELSSISKLDDRLEGHAKDPITAGLSLEAIIDPGYFGRTGGHVLCLGAGGSAVATLLYIMNKPDKADRPEKFIVVNRSPGRLEHMKEMVDKLGTDIEVEYIHNANPRVNDDLMARLPDYSLVINATGMGKDSPGSPITDAGIFPRKGIAWEFNYRGELDFMHQALRQVDRRELTVEDGWIYFVHGWSQVVAQVLHIDLTHAVFDQLEQAAATVR